MDLTEEDLELSSPLYCAATPIEKPEFCFDAKDGVDSGYGSNGNHEQSQIEAKNSARLPHAIQAKLTENVQIAGSTEDGSAVLPIYQTTSSRLFDDDETSMGAEELHDVHVLVPAFGHHNVLAHHDAVDLISHADSESYAGSEIQEGPNSEIEADDGTAPEINGDSFIFEDTLVSFVAENTELDPAAEFQREDATLPAGEEALQANSESSSFQTSVADISTGHDIGANGRTDYPQILYISTVADGKQLQDYDASFFSKDDMGLFSGESFEDAENDSVAAGPKHGKFELRVNNKSSKLPTKNLFSPINFTDLSVGDSMELNFCDKSCPVGDGDLGVEENRLQDIQHLSTTENTERDAAPEMTVEENLDLYADEVASLRTHDNSPTPKAVGTSVSAVVDVYTEKPQATTVQLTTIDDLVPGTLKYYPVQTGIAVSLAIGPDVSHQLFQTSNRTPASQKRVLTISIEDSVLSISSSSSSSPVSTKSTQTEITFASSSSFSSSSSPPDGSTRCMTALTSFNKKLPDGKTGLHALSAQVEAMKARLLELWSRVDKLERRMGVESGTGRLKNQDRLELSQVIGLMDGLTLA